MANFASVLWGALFFGSHDNTYIIPTSHQRFTRSHHAGDPALKIKPDTNMKLWNNHPQTGGEFIKKNEATKN